MFLLSSLHFSLADSPGYLPLITVSRFASSSLVPSSVSQFASFSSRPSPYSYLPTSFPVSGAVSLLSFFSVSPSLCPSSLAQVAVEGRHHQLHCHLPSIVVEGP